MNRSTRADVPAPTAQMDEPTRQQIVKELTSAYNMEVETVANYLVNSIHLDGMLAMEVKESLASDLAEELEHAKQLARRIKILGGKPPGSQALKMEQAQLQPPDDSIDVTSVIRGVIDAETDAINQYQRIIEMTDGVDYVTQDLCINLKGDEEEHRREFVGFLREYEAMQRGFK
ncbi:MAG: ferritin-like domain-containing protein [Phycisphaeraceae bacterium]